MCHQGTFARSWRARFIATGLAGLADRPHHPPPRAYSPDIQAQIVVLATKSRNTVRRNLAALTRIRRNWRSADVAAVLVGTPRHDEGYAYYSKT